MSRGIDDFGGNDDVYFECFVSVASCASVISSLLRFLSLDSWLSCFIIEAASGVNMKVLIQGSANHDH